MREGQTITCDVRMDAFYGRSDGPAVGYRLTLDVGDTHVEKEYYLLKNDPKPVVFYAVILTKQILEELDLDGGWFTKNAVICIQEVLIGSIIEATTQDLKAGRL